MDGTANLTHVRRAGGPAVPDTRGAGNSTMQNCTMQTGRSVRGVRSTRRDAGTNRFGVPRALSVRYIPARSLTVAIADQAWSHLSGFCQVDAHDPVAGGRDSTTATVLTVAQMQMAQRRVPLISAPDTQRGPVVCDDPGGAHRALAGANGSLPAWALPLASWQPGHGSMHARPTRDGKRQHGSADEADRREQFHSPFHPAPPDQEEHPT
jgi:hypothetical protein